MRDACIRAEGLSKRYRIGQLLRHRTFRDVLAGGLAAPYRWTASLLNGGQGRNGDKSEIWALKDVSFKIDAGEVVAIIGRNGAGKSTLLKVLSRIIEPTEGFAELHGRVGSLLEVGTGFHPQLTGRENIYLNGAILGMRRREIARKFDEIVAFAETEQFLDTAVKYYSSGMFMRLGFAVAAHLDPEILLVDEVLAVGDLAFQRKCLAKIKDVAREGRTVLFVSHQMNSVRTLCDRAIWLEAGQIKQSGPMPEVTNAYEASFTSSATATRNGQSENSAAKFVSWEIVHPRTEQPHVLETQGPVTIRVTLEVHRHIRHGVHGIALWNKERQLIWGWATDGLDLPPGVHGLQFHLPGLPLKPGAYTWDVSLRSDGNFIDRWNCTPPMMIATTPLADPRDEWSGLLNIPCEFHILEEARR
jgi:homopolymeric O-antigen transport system ATP-binding protein